MVATTFYNLKFGDRFYYESNNPETRFTLRQLDSIRKYTLSTLLCNQLGTKKVPRSGLFGVVPKSSDRSSNTPSIYIHSKNSFYETYAQVCDSVKQLIKNHSPNLHEENYNGHDCKSQDSYSNCLVSCFSPYALSRQLDLRLWTEY